MFIVSLKVGAIVSKCFPSKRNLFWASLAFFGNACLGLLPAQICPAALPAWISSWLNLEPHLPVRGDRICGVMLHCPWWSRDTTRAALGMERFPVFPRKNGKVGGGGGERERTSQNSGDKALRMSGSCCRVIVLDCSHQRASGAGICVPQGLRTVTSRGPQIHVCTSLQTR